MTPTRFSPARDSTGWKWACHLCPTGDAGYLTRWGARLVQGRHIRACRRLAAARPAPAPVIGPTCDASIHAATGNPLGPCILRYDHDGPVHQAADGARWWPTL